MSGHGGRRFGRREMLRGCLAAGAVPLIAACSPPSLPSGATAAVPTSEPRRADRPPSTAAPATARSAPTGRLVYGWHTAISPAWLDPQESPPQITPFNFAYALHDALVKHMPGRPFAPSLAESYTIAPDHRSAEFKLRQGIKFHDGSPVTADDVKYSFERYRGANASILKEKTAAFEVGDSRTVRLQFKEPFLDFLTLYGSPASGAGWIVPKAYYEQVGPDGFKQKPIGAGPFRFVKQQAGSEIEFEAFPDYWGTVPSVKKLVLRAVPEASARVALLQTGEADVTNLIPGDLVDAVRRDPKLRLVPVKSGPGWLELTSYDRPDSPLKDLRVRRAVSLAIDRRAISDAEMAGLGAIEGNWIPEDWPGALMRPAPEHDLALAKQLLAEAGVPNGFEVSMLTPQPPYVSWGERLVSQLGAIGVRTRLNTMERGAFYDKLSPGPDRLKGLLLLLSGAPGDAAARIRENAVCNGAFSGVCQPEVDDRMRRYDASADPAERQRLLNEVQAHLLDTYTLVPTVRLAMLNALGPRIANRAEEIMGSIPQYVYIGPYEAIQLVD